MGLLKPSQAEFFNFIVERKDRNDPFLTILTSQQELVPPTKRFSLFPSFGEIAFIYCVWCNSTAFWAGNCAELAIRILLKFML